MVRGMHEFTSALANDYAGLALANVSTEYPNHVQHLMHGDEDARTPRQLHPAFFGSYDWHSSVHMHWLLVRCIRLHRRIPLARPVVETLNAHLAPEHLEAERAYLRVDGRAAFERPYGWAWLLKLAHEAELLAQAEPVARRWSDTIDPLARDLALRLREYLQRAPYPQRAGAHGNTAFALAFAFEWASQAGDTLLARTIRETAERWYGRDKDYPARYEPSADDFLSAGLCEAALMQRLMNGLGFSVWWGEFCPKGEDFAVWLAPAHVGDRKDPKLAHLDGLNLSRAWCMRRLRAAVGPQQALQFDQAITAHLEAALPQASGGAYVGSHWLASFAALALTD